MFQSKNVFHKGGERAGGILEVMSTLTGQPWSGLSNVFQAEV